MSIKLMSAAWDLPPKTLPKGCKFLLVALCDNANDQGVCFPSVEYLANKCEMSVRTVQNHVQWLAEHNYLSLEERKGRSTIYTIHYATLLHPELVNTDYCTDNSDPRKICTPADFSKTPAKSAPTPADFSKTPAKSAPITITNPHLTVTQPRSTAKSVKMSKPEVVVVSNAAQLEACLPWPDSLTTIQRQVGAGVVCGLPLEQADACVRLLTHAMLTREIKNPVGYLASLSYENRKASLLLFAAQLRKEGQLCAA